MIQVTTRRLKRDALAYEPEQQLPATPGMVRTLLTKTSSLTALLIRLAYATAQRPGDVLQLQKKSFTVVGSWMAVTFYRGKVVPMIGPYTIHISLTSAVAQAILHLMTHSTVKDFSREATFFHEKVGQEMDDVLSDFGLGRRSLRRGALQALAALGAPTSVLLYYSKHKSIPMLERYLGHGKLHLCQPMAAAPYAAEITL